MSKCVSSLSRNTSQLLLRTESIIEIVFSWDISANTKLLKKNYTCQKNKMWSCSKLNMYSLIRQESFNKWKMVKISNGDSLKFSYSFFSPKFDTFGFVLHWLWVYINSPSDSPLHRQHKILLKFISSSLARVQTLLRMTVVPIYCLKKHLGCWSTKQQATDS